MSRKVLAMVLLLACLFPTWGLAQQGGCDTKVKDNDIETYNNAVDLYKKKRLADATKKMRRVAQTNPKAADPQFYLGLISVDNGFKPASIRKYFTRCLELCPDYPDARAHYYMGMILYTDERYEEAAAALEKYFALANNTNRPEWLALYEEASAYLHWSQFLAEANLNRVPFDPKPLARVSSKRNENLPYITPDGRRCYYLRQVPVEQDRTKFYNMDVEKTVWQLYFSDRKEGDSLFDAGHPMPPPFNQGDADGSVTATADGRTLFFARISPSAGYANSDIYSGKWDEESGKWIVDRLGNGINGDKSWESHPSVSPDGQWLYFASNRKGGQGGTDIWRCHRLKNGDWSRAENLGSSVNTSGNEKFPFLHPDGHTLYFVSDGWQGFGGYDIYFIDLAAGGNGSPTNLGLPINSEDDELSFGVTPDGQQGYFADRVATSRSRDILTFPLYPAARPTPMALCHATLSASGQQKDTLFMLPTRVATPVTLGMGTALPYIACATARHFSSLSISLSDTIAPLLLKPDEGNRLSANDERLLDAWAAWLIEHPRVHIAIESPKQALAKAVYDYLLSKKLRAERLSHRGGTAFTKNQIRLQ
jgi:hypothetical protein